MEMTFIEAVLGFIYMTLFHPIKTLVVVSALFFGGTVFFSLPGTYWSWFIFFVYSLFAAVGVMKVVEEIDS